jgi:hypothetical protein
MWRVERNCTIGHDMDVTMSCLVTDSSFSCVSVAYRASI